MRLTQPEQIKRKPEDFGGIQFQQLEQEECATRLCAARWCGNPGFGQLASWDSYRILCKVHLVRMYIATSTAIGDPSPLADARAVADLIGVDWSAMLREKPYAEPIKPEEFRCILCGGMMMAETIGMLSGRRWIHTCGETKSATIEVGNLSPESLSVLIGLPIGLCGNREPHAPHEVTEGSLAPFWCTADQSQREPYRSETHRKDGEHTCPRCGSTRWVSVSLDEGWTRIAQCVPCSAYGDKLGPGWKAGGVR